MGFFDSIFKIFDPIVKIVEKAISWLIPMPEIPDYGDNLPEQNAKGVLVNKTSSNAHIPVVYGTRKVGGNVVFLETSGTDNTYLYMAIVLSEGEITDINQIYVNDNLVTWSGDLADNTQVTVNASDLNYYKDDESLITVEPHFGSDSQTASSLLSTLSSWGSNHRLQGLSYLALDLLGTLTLSVLFQQFTQLLKGKKFITQI